MWNSSTVVVKLQVETVQAALSSRPVVAPCLAMNSHHDSSLVTEPSVHVTASQLASCL